jgi:uncharacterized membrane protein HdeD (DUF308 family)
MGFILGAIFIALATEHITCLVRLVKPLPSWAVVATAGVLSVSVGLVLYPTLPLVGLGAWGISAVIHEATSLASLHADSMKQEVILRASPRGPRSVLPPL